MPGPYTPPQPHRAQAVRSVRGEARQRWRWRWLVPLLGLLPVVAVAVLASGIGLLRTGSTPAPTAPLAGGSVATPAPTVAPLATATASTSSAAAAAPTAAANQSVSGSTPMANSAGATPTTSAEKVATATAQTGSRTAASSSDGGPFVAYRVQPGDTVRFVAQVYGVSTASIAQASGLQNADLVRPGQVLTVPTRPGWLYRVQPGETLDQIAARTGIASQTILSASGLTMASVGDVVLIPDAAAAQSK